ncbi:hypothetical protein HYW21_01180 [Candidatus Woesearchaeota archaeon]|nr:hypothetical protein [Candidatus Woesearchaeota archaeon]
MEAKNKIYIKKVNNEDNYNELDIEKSEIFLENLQDFIVDIGLAKVNKGEYEFNGKSYDMKTYYTLFFEDPKDDFQMKKLTVEDFGDGKIARYVNKEIELLIIFLSNRIKLIFYCDMKNREKTMKSLLKFCKIMKVCS